MAQVCELAVEGRILTICGGVPIWMGNVDHGPSLPSNFWVGAMEMGAGIGVVARLPNCRPHMLKDQEYNVKVLFNVLPSQGIRLIATRLQERKVCKKQKSRLMKMADLRQRRTKSKNSAQTALLDADRAEVLE